jgi:hypothetical protein
MACQTAAVSAEQWQTVVGKNNKMNCSTDRFKQALKVSCTLHLAKSLRAVPASIALQCTDLLLCAVLSTCAEANTH